MKRVIQVLLGIALGSMAMGQVPGSQTQKDGGRRDVIPYDAALDASAIHQSVLNELTNSIIIGNGDINGLIYSVGGNINISLTKNDVWDARILTEKDPPLFKVNIRSGTWSGGAPEGSTPPSYNDHPFPTPVYCAIISIGNDKKPATAVTVKQDLYTMVTDSSLENTPIVSTLDIKRAKAVIERGSRNPPAIIRTLAQKNVFMIETDEKVRLLPSDIPFVPKPQAGMTDGVEWLHYSLPGDADWKGMEYVVAKGTVDGLTIVSIVTSYDTKDFFPEALRLVKQALAEERSKLIRKHEDEWSRFWSASGVQIKDSFLNATWYRNLYFMRCISKNGVTPAGLLAGLVPANDYKGAAWKGSFTLDYNGEQMYWAWYGCNHKELSEPYEKIINDYLPRAEWFARQTYDCKGAFFPVNVYIHEPMAMDGLKSVNKRMTAYIPWSYVPAISGWTVQNLWLHYKYYPDTLLLRRNLYPALRAAAVFYLDFIGQCKRDGDGKAIIGPTYSPEHGNFGVYEGTADIAFMRHTFNIVIECSQILKTDKGLAAQCASALRLLPAYPLSAATPPVVVDYKDSKTAEYNVAVPVLPIYPADEVNWFSRDGDKDLFDRTIDQLKWNGNNAMIMLAISRARLSMPGTFDWTKKYLSQRLKPNGTFGMNRVTGKPGFNDLGNYTEQFAASGVINELLLQSVGGILRFFPAWPAGEDAAFTRLRSEGGFLVSSRMKGDGIQDIRIQSTAGGVLRFLNPWKGGPLIVKNGKAVSVRDEGNGIFSLPTIKGDQLILKSPSL
jgi:hypothetical protein